MKNEYFSLFHDYYFVVKNLLRLIVSFFMNGMEIVNGIRLFATLSVIKKQLVLFIYLKIFNVANF